MTVPPFTECISKYPFLILIILAELLSCCKQRTDTLILGNIAANSSQQHEFHVNLPRHSSGVWELGFAVSGVETNILSKLRIALNIENLGDRNLHIGFGEDAVVLRPGEQRAVFDGEIGQLEMGRQIVTAGENVDVNFKLMVRLEKPLSNGAEIRVFAFFRKHSL